MKKINIICLGFFLLIQTSCNSWLDVDLKSQMEESKLFSTEQGFHEALAGIYSSMVQSDMYGQRLTYGFMDVLGQTYDVYRLNPTYSKYANYEYSDKDMVSIFSDIWYKEYNAIAGLNNILKYIEINGDKLRPEIMEQIKGEALGLRAFLHFDIYRMYAADVKLKPDVERLPYNTVFGVETPVLSSTKDYIGLVVKDLEEALTCLENDPIRTAIPWQLGNEKGQNKDEADLYVARMNYFAVQALLARVYLAKGDQVNARRMAEEVITAEQFRLVDYKTSLDVEEAQMDALFSDEHIFSLRNKGLPDLTKGLLNQSNAQGTNLQLHANYVILFPTTEDIRFDKWIAQGVITKYKKNNTTRFFPKVPLIRLSEMYFIAAETWLEENPDKAKDYMDRLRDSRIRNNTPLGSFTEEDLITEMRRDFLAEGQMFFVYKRLNHAIPQLSGEPEIRPDDNKFVFPLPENEVTNGNRNI